MTDESAAVPESIRPSRFGLSGKLLVLTLLFVMIAEVLIYVPSIANFRLNWLQDRLSAAYTAALVFGASLAHLDTSPHLYGWTWDFKAPDNTHTVVCNSNDYGLSKISGVAADAAVCFQMSPLRTMSPKPTTTDHGAGST